MSGYAVSNAESFVGKELAVSDWTTVDQKLIDAFAHVTGDHQWIHQAGDRASGGPFGAPVAHGLLVLSLTFKLAEASGALPHGASLCVNYGFDRIRFPAPVPAGARVRLRSSLVAAEKRAPGQTMITTRYTVEVESSDKPALVADCLGLFFD